MRPPIVLAALVASLVACGAGATPVADPPDLRGTHSCPLGVAGAHVTLDDTGDGAIFTFTTTKGVDELRQRVANAAAMYGPGAHRGLGHHGGHGGGQRHGLALSELPITTSVEAIEGGARLHVSITDLARRLEVQRSLRERAERVAAGECP